MKRRDFIKSGLVGAALLSMPEAIFAKSPELSDAAEDLSKKIHFKPTAKADSFHFGMAGYTYVHFDIDTTLAFMKRLDVHYLCIKDFHLPLDSTEEQIAAFKKKLADSDVTGYAVGPIYMKSEAEVDRAFEYARKVGVKLIVGVPNHEYLPYVEQMVQKYDMRLAIHLHGPDMPIYPDAEDIWNHIKDLNPRIGMCLDIGHDMRYGQDPIADLKRYHSRVYDMHIKDVTGPTKADKSIELGRGRIDFPLLIKTLRKVGYSGSCSLEYEKDMKDPFAGIAESTGYFRAVCNTTR